MSTYLVESAICSQAAFMGDRVGLSVNGVCRLPAKMTRGPTWGAAVSSLVRLV